ncbi:sulfite exporter TauE/SafE family protein [Ammoniphilus sp. CFH 90114]|uniref:sulfite exporter TauE/SafE family protein n=1 Tax=Ammoniphilus sp. CFH 90114 TaxID=2493665 RepID=UPI00100E1E8E|nr:sulfite exporter TauE/SafE family protein [Ammoniphilus sp. CFH 90114]RXT07925.1 sulfite exporter TauE/SafE family protein [Ammoniphilus sp. CFH 90114]
MDILLYVVMLVLGLIGSFFSGLLGIGGAIINYPLLLYVPDLLGVAQFSAQEVSSISMFQVLFASLAGVLAFRKHGGENVIHKRLVLYMGVSILIGSLLGGIVSRYLPSAMINLVYGVLAILAVVLMLIPSKGQQEQTVSTDIPFNKVIAISSAFSVGVVSGIVGAGGAFILIPIMLTVLKIPTRVTIASSLAIVFISAVGGSIGKLMAGFTPFLPTVFTVIGSILGAPIGSMVGRGVNVKVLRYGLVVLISITAFKIWSEIL